MVSLKRYRELSREYNELKRKSRTLDWHKVSDSIGQRDCQPIISPTKEAINQLREESANKMKKLIPLIRSKEHLNEKIGDTHSPSEYVNIEATCTKCKKTFTDLINLYIEFDPKDLVCDECKLREKNSETAERFHGATDFVPEFDEHNHIIRLNFTAKNGTKYTLYCGEDNDNLRSLTLEEE
jgi:hypothetical protein